MTFPWLTVLVAVPLVGALVVGFLPSGGGPGTAPGGRPCRSSPRWACRC